MAVLTSADAGACARALLSNNASGATDNMFQVMQLPQFNTTELQGKGKSGQRRLAARALP